MSDGIVIVIFLYIIIVTMVTILIILWISDTWFHQKLFWSSLKHTEVEGPSNQASWWYVCPWHVSFTQEQTSIDITALHCMQDSWREKLYIYSICICTVYIYRYMCIALYIHVYIYIHYVYIYICIYLCVWLYVCAFVDAAFRTCMHQ